MNHEQTLENDPPLSIPDEYKQHIDVLIKEYDDIFFKRSY